MQTRRLAAAAGLAAIAGLFATPVHAAPVIHSVKAAGTTSVLHGQDRELMQLAFTGTSFTMAGPDFLRFTDGALNNNAGAFGWNAPINRDVNSNNNYSGNPDRADGSTPYLLEANAQGTLAEVFGPFSGYKNMSRLIDGEDNGAWTLDLFFAPGQHLNADEDDSTIELAILERGVNSDLNIYGITAGNSMTAPIFVSRSAVGSAGWSLDTLEINGAQTVGGVGISLDSSWTGLIGFRFESKSNFNGPDLIAVGTPATVPAPGTLALAGLAGLTARRRLR